MSSPSPEPAGAQGATETTQVHLHPAFGAPPAAAPYFPPPPYPPPGLSRGIPTDGRAITSLIASIFGLLLALPFGVPGLFLGPLGYFMGRSAIARIDSAPGTAGGRGIAAAGWVLGAVATAVGAVVTLVWLVLLLIAISTAPTTFE